MSRATGVRAAWPLDPDVVFLNHGSFGACPTRVLEHQHELRARLERQPVRFFVRELESMWDEARASVAEYVHCDPDDLVSVTNATAGVNAVLQSFPFEPGDEILLSDQAYPACRNAIADACERTGAVAVLVRLSLSGSDDEDVSRFVGAVTNRTRLALVDHIASPTGTIVPVRSIVEELRARGVRVLIDGAHAPGMVPLDLSSLGADFYVGNCHKWLCAPKGSGFLHVSRENQSRMRPLSVSLGYRSPRRDRSAFLIEFAWTGTHDPTPFLSVPHAIRYVASLHAGGWEGIRQRNHELVRRGATIVARSMGADWSIEDSRFGSMAALRLPDRKGPAPVPPMLDDLQDWLYQDHAIEVPVVTWPEHPCRLIRLSAHLYNDAADYEALGRALRQRYG